MEGAVEASILFAAGFVEGARACLAELRDRDIGAPRAWTLIFDLHRALGERSAFVELLEQFGAIFPDVAQPCWASPGIPGGGVVALEGRISSAADLDPVRNVAKSRIVVLDFGRLSRIDFTVAPELCALLRVYVDRSVRVILANVSELHELLLRETGLPTELTLLPRRTAAPTLATVPMGLAA